MKITTLWQPWHWLLKHFFRIQPSLKEATLSDTSQIGFYKKKITEDNCAVQQKQQELGVVHPQVVDKETSSTDSSGNGENNLVAVMVQEQNVANDGADEQMLGTEDNAKLAERRDEVKFIKGDRQNGDAKIDIGIVNGKSFTGMTKEELMKYANDPFWVRLRWIFFVAFWAIWVGMLVGAIFIIIDAPKCAAPEPLPWYKRGLHAKFGAVETVKPEDVQIAAKLKASGVIYELPSTLTYKVREPGVESKIKKIVDQYKGTNVKLILDVTPNVVSADSQLYKDALNNEGTRTAFIWLDNVNKEPTNWLKVGGNTTAWSKVGTSYVLSQFGDDIYDLRMNDTIVRREFSNVLKHLLALGVNGFRLKNTKFFMISPNLEDEVNHAYPKNYNLSIEDYGFYNHKQTTFQQGLGDILYDYLKIVKNISSDAFLSVAEDLIRPEAYKISQHDGILGIDLPMYGQFIKTVCKQDKIPRNLQDELEQTRIAVGNNSWLQWDFGDAVHNSPLFPSSLVLFMSLLPGVPIVPVDSLSYKQVSAHTYEDIERLRKSPSYMHGELHIYESEPLLAYSTIKSGNPGYFVVFNPTPNSYAGNFSNLNDLPDKMTVVHVSENYQNFNQTEIAVKARVDVENIEIEGYSTVILTYVPIKAD